MAAVLSALAPYVLQLIKDVPEEEVRMLLGVSGEIEKLGDKVGNLEAYLLDAERRRIDNAMVQRWVSKLKDALYDATDILELCRLDAKESNDRPSSWSSMVKKAPGCLRPLLFCLGNPAFAHHMGKRIKALNESLDAISKDISSFGFAKLDAYQLRTATSEATPNSRMTTSMLDESAIVGDAIQEDTNTLLQVLLPNKLSMDDENDAQQALRVVSIVGAGGIGKTTLAKKIFNDRAIQTEFRSKVWLSVTQSYDEEKLLSSAITQALQAEGRATDPAPPPAEATYPQGHGGDKQTLTQTLARILSMGKYLLVMDDIWSDGPWTHVLQGPLVHAAGSQQGSRVIITTRNQDLVKHMGAEYHQHYIKPMSHEDAWSLLKKQLPPQDIGSEGALDDGLKQIGMEIIKKCDGLPLAIKAVGGLLRTKRATEREWKSILNDPRWSTDKTHADLNSALHLSYEDMCPPLKQCFLYYSLLDNGCPRHIVVGMWMSEGFLGVPTDDERRQEQAGDIGMGYYRDLITRNLIEPISSSGAQRGRESGAAYMMHDVIRSFAQYMAKEEALVVRLGQTTSPLISSQKFRRLSIESSKFESPSSLKWSSISGKQELVRTLIIHGMINFEPTTSSEPSLSRFPSLRVLRLSHLKADRLIDSLVNLKLLRFLFLEHTDISRLPDDIEKIKFLQHVWVGGCPNFAGQLPSSMLKLEYLRSLCLMGTRFLVPKGLGGLTHLRVLRNFPVQVDGEWCSLQELGTLSQLRMLAIEGVEAVPSSVLAAKAKIRDMEQLRTLILSSWERYHPNPRVTWLECRRLEEVFDELCPPPHLEKLIIGSYMGLRPPSWMCVALSSVDFSSLRNLKMMRLPFCTQLPDGLCRLRSLEKLVISYAPYIERVGPEFQKTSGGVSFPRLQVLMLHGLQEWMEWEWENEGKGEDEGEVEVQTKTIAMPSLHTLHIVKCKLGCLPAGLASSRRLALTQLWLYDVARITTVENFPSVVELDVRVCPSLEVIRSFPSMQRVTVMSCPKLQVLECGPAMHTMVLSDATMKELPEYVRDLKPRVLRLDCHPKLRHLLSSSNSDHTSAEYKAEMDKLHHCEKLLLL